MRLSTKPMPVQIEPVDQLELLQLQEGMSSAYEALLDAQKNLDEVQEVMGNITDSMNLITKYGQAGVEQLNVGGDLEELLQIPAKLITAEKAQEGLGKAAKELFVKFCKYIRDLWNKIVDFFTNITKRATNSVRALRAAYKNAGTASEAYSVDYDDVVTETEWSTVHGSKRKQFYKKLSAEEKAKLGVTVADVMSIVTSGGVLLGKVEKEFDRIVHAVFHSNEYGSTFDIGYLDDERTKVASKAERLSNTPFPDIKGVNVKHVLEVIKEVWGTNKFVDEVENIDKKLKMYNEKIDSITKNLDKMVDVDINEQKLIDIRKAVTNLSSLCKQVASQTSRCVGWVSRFAKMLV